VERELLVVRPFGLPFPLLPTDFFVYLGSSTDLIAELYFASWDGTQMSGLHFVLELWGLRGLMVANFLVADFGLGTPRRLGGLWFSRSWRRIETFFAGLGRCLVVELAELTARERPRLAFVTGRRGVGAWEDASERSVSSK
jgi:hypothetical protein